jgi:hypothetical protein
MRIETFFVDHAGIFKLQIIEENEKDVTFIILDCPEKIKHDIGKTKTVPKNVHDSIRRDFLAYSINY